MSYILGHARAGQLSREASSLEVLRVCRRHGIADRLRKAGLAAGPSAQTGDRWCPGLDIAWGHERRCWDWLFLELHIARLCAIKAWCRDTRRRQVIWKRHISGGAEQKHIRAMFVLNAKDRPHSTTENLRQGYDKAENSRVLEVVYENGVENPVEPNDDVQDHCDVVDPYTAEGEYFTQEFVFGIWVAQTPIHDQIPHRYVDSIQETERDECCLEASVSIDAVHAQSRVVQDGEDILSQIQEMRESIPSVRVTANTLKGSPDRREGGEEAQKAGMGRVAPYWAGPVGSI